MTPNAERALVVIASIAVIFLLYFGAPFFIPLLVALLISYALSPLVDLLTRVVRVRAIAASLVVAGLLGLVGTGAWTWSDDVSALWDRVPEASRALARAFRQVAQKPASPMAEMKKAVNEIESLAQTGKSAPVAPATPGPAQSAGSFWNVAWMGGKGILIAIIQATAVVFLVFFMLASGDLFKRKIVKIAGTTLAQRRITVEVIDEIDQQIRRYLMVVAVSNLLVGLGTWIVFRFMGVNYAELWSVAAAILHTAPYFGPALIAAATFVGALVQFGDLSHALLVAAATIGVATLVGSLFTTWFASKHTRMNATATFVGLLFFGWIWGLWGVLLAIPILAIVKTICDYNEAWKPIGELLSK